MNKMVVFLGIMSLYQASYAMLPQPQPVQLLEYDDAQDMLVNNELQCLTCYTASGITMLRKSIKLKNEPLNVVASQELKDQKKACLEFKENTLFRQKARRNVMRQITRINRALASRYSHPSVCVDLTDKLNNA